MTTREELKAGKEFLIVDELVNFVYYIKGNNIYRKGFNDKEKKYFTATLLGIQTDRLLYQVTTFGQIHSGVIMFDNIVHTPHEKLLQRHYGSGQ